MHKQPEVTERTKSAFISVFCELYKEKPIEKITVQEITNRSGYNRSTFYQHFTDIYDLLDYVERDVLAYAQDMPLPNIAAGQLDDVLIHRIALLFEEKSDYLGALLGDYGSVRFIDKIKANMMVNVTEAATYLTGNALLPYIREFAVSAAISMFRYWYRNNKDISSEELVSLIRALFTDGVLVQLQRVALQAGDCSGETLSPV